MKQLIVNADDFGLSSGVNRAIIHAWRKGILTSASLMVTGEAAAEAIALAKENPGLQVGLHLTLVQGRAVLRHRGFPALTDHDGNFPNDPVLAGMRYFFLNSLRGQLRAEIEAQILRFRESGLPLGHIDGHLNIHMHPTVFDILLPLMGKYDIETFRLSRERLGVELSLAPRRIVGKAADAFIFGRLAARCRPALDLRRVGYAAEVKGLLNSGRMVEKYLLAALHRLQDGLTEIYFHPGCVGDPVLLDRMPDYRHAGELEALTSARVKENLRVMGIGLVNYRGEAKEV